MPRPTLLLGCFLAGAVAVPASQYSRKTLQQHHEEPYAPRPANSQTSAPAFPCFTLTPSAMHLGPRLQGAQVTTAALCGRSDAPRLAVASYRASSAQLWLQGREHEHVQNHSDESLGEQDQRVAQGLHLGQCIRPQLSDTRAQSAHPNLLRLMLGVRAHFGPGGPVQCHDDGDGEGHARSRSLDAERAQLRK